MWINQIMRKTITFLTIMASFTAILYIAAQGLAMLTGDSLETVFFVPSVILLAVILIFSWSGTTGLFAAGLLSSYWLANPLPQSILFALTVAGAPMLTVWIFSRHIDLRNNLSNLQARDLLNMVFYCALITALATALRGYYFGHSQLLLSEQFFLVFSLDLSITLTLLYAAKYLIQLMVERHAQD